MKQNKYDLDNKTEEQIMDDMAALSSRIYNWETKNPQVEEYKALSKYLYQRTGWSDSIIDEGVRKAIKRLAQRLYAPESVPVDLLQAQYRTLTNRSKLFEQNYYDRRAIGLIAKTYKERTGKKIDEDVILLQDNWEIYRDKPDKLFGDHLMTLYDLLTPEQRQMVCDAKVSFCYYHKKKMYARKGKELGKVLIEPLAIGNRGASFSVYAPYDGWYTSPFAQYGYGITEVSTVVYSDITISETYVLESETINCMPVCLYYTKEEPCPGIEINEIIDSYYSLKMYNKFLKVEYRGKKRPYCISVMNETAFEAYHNTLKTQRAKYALAPDFSNFADKLISGFWTGISLGVIKQWWKK